MSETNVFKILTRNHFHGNGLQALNLLLYIHEFLTGNLEVLKDYLIEVGKNLVEHSHTFYTLIVRIQLHIEVRKITDGSK